MFSLIIAYPYIRGYVIIYTSCVHSNSHVSCENLSTLTMNAATEAYHKTSNLNLSWNHRPGFGVCFQEICLYLNCARFSCVDSLSAQVDHFMWKISHRWVSWLCFSIPLLMICWCVWFMYAKSFRVAPWTWGNHVIIPKPEVQLHVYEGKQYQTTMFLCVLIVHLLILYLMYLYSIYKCWLVGKEFNERIHI